MYLPPVSRLIALGDPSQADHWPNYLGMGIDARCIDELCRMAADDDLYARIGNDPAFFAPIHAWMALGVLRAETAIPTLIAQLHRIDDEAHDWAGEELPPIFGMLGPACIAPLAAYVHAAANCEMARIAAIEGLRHVAIVTPDSRLASASALQALLQHPAENPPSLNGVAINALVNLAPVDSIPLIEAAFEAEAVDEMFTGDLDAIRERVNGMFNPPSPSPLLREQDIAKLNIEVPHEG